MLINAQHTDQVRVAIVDGTTLESYQVEVAESGLTRGNIYRGVVANVQPSLNAAFVDLGEEKHGFLSLDDTMAAAYHKQPPEEKGRPRIDQVLERKRPILVQVTKDGGGSKGPALTTNLLFAGRYLVMMPLDSVRGISRKIEEDQLRKTVKGRLAKLEVPEGMGVIVRTNGLDQTQAMLNRDLGALVRLWRRIESEARSGKGPRLLYNDQDLILQALRDFLDTSITQVLVDTEAAHKRAERFMATFMPRSKTELIRYDERLPLFSRYHLENQIDRIYNRSVPLASGGSIVIDPTEALTAIDVNSGRATKRTDHEESILAVNLEAADEIGRQLRLRDIGGLVVVDFIDMRLRKHQNKVEKAMRDALKSDRARHTVSRTSANGLVEINRQRLKQALRSRVHRPCPTCEGVGSIPSLEFSAINLLRRIEARAAIGNLAGVVVGLHPEVADALQNNHRSEIVGLEEEFDLHIEIIAAANLHRTEERVEWKQDREAGHREAGSHALTAVDLATGATVTTRRRRRGGRGGASNAAEAVIASEPVDHPSASEPVERSPATEHQGDAEVRPKRRRRRGGRGRKRAQENRPAADRERQPAARQPAASVPLADGPPPAPSADLPSAERKDPSKPRRRRGGRGRSRSRDDRQPAPAGNRKKVIEVHTVVTEDGYVDDDSQLRFFGAAPPRRQPTAAPGRAAVSPSRNHTDGFGSSPPRSRRGGRSRLAGRATLPAAAKEANGAHATAPEMAPPAPPSPAGPAPEAAAASSESTQEGTAAARGEDPKPKRSGPRTTARSRTGGRKRATAPAKPETQAPQPVPEPGSAGAEAAAQGTPDTEGKDPKPKRSGPRTTARARTGGRKRATTPAKPETQAPQPEPSTPAAPPEPASGSEATWPWWRNTPPSEGE